ncbi:MAG TPA: hypothetical protein VJN43_16620 [Bryobacteraceae bacterium]|nr:hypothetical protein [Bryobacteraceae bacterium]
MDAEFAQSLNRRLRFGAQAQHWISRLMPGPVARLPRASLVNRGLEILAQSACDALESVRAGRLVSGFGRPAPVAARSSDTLAQHPRYRTYWRSQPLNSTVGMHLGVDLIQHDGLYYPIELNFDAVFPPARRALYEADIDPAIRRLCELARETGHRRLVCFHRKWSNAQVKEFQAAGRRYALEVIPAASCYAPAGAQRMLDLPPDLPANTLFVIHHYQYTPLDALMTNKAYTAEWLAECRGLVGHAPAFGELRVPPRDPSGRWPNLVVKLTSGHSGGSAVQMLNVAGAGDALRALEIDRHGFPRVFRRSAIARIAAAASRQQKVIYQPFITPETESDDYVQILRAHILFTPICAELLSVHRVISTIPLPGHAPRGLIRDPRPYVVTYSQNPRFALPDEQTYHEVKEVARELGAVIRRRITATFATGDGEPAPVSLATAE